MGTCHISCNYQWQSWTSSSLYKQSYCPFCLQLNLILNSIQSTKQQGIKYLFGSRISPSIEKALSEEVEVAGKAQCERQNIANNGNSLWFSLHQLHGLSLISKAPRNSKYLDSSLDSFSFRDRLVEREGELLYLFRRHLVERCLGLLIMELFNL